MRKNFIFSFAIFAILLSTHCDLKAQWVKVSCPLNPQALIERDGFLFAGSDGGVVRTSDNGSNWKVVNNGLVGDVTPAAIISFLSMGKYLLAGATYDGGVLYSTNDGNSWTRSNQPFSFSPLSFASLDKYIFTSSGNSYMLRSSDSGKSWFENDSGFGYRLSIIYLDPTSTAVASNDKFVFGGNPYGQIFRSSNNGDFWGLVYDGSQDTGNRMVSVISANGSTIFAQIGDTIIRSLDNGDHWSKVKKSFGTNTFIFSNNIIFAGGYFGVIYSSNNGYTWNSASQGLPDSVVIDAFTIQNNYLYTGAYETLPFSSGGLWRRLLSDFADVKGSSPSQNSFTLFPNPATSQATISFTLAKSSNVTFEIYDLLGRRMKQVSLSTMSAGEHSEKLDLHGLGDGTYLCRVSVDGEISSMMFTVLR